MKYSLLMVTLPSKESHGQRCPYLSGEFVFDFGREWEHSTFSVRRGGVGREQTPHRPSLRMGTSGPGRWHLSLVLRLFHYLNLISMLMNTEHKLW